MASLPTNPETDLIKKAEFTDAEVRQVEFVELFKENITKLVEALGVTRKIPKAAGTALKVKKATGTLSATQPGEGETIPLSKYKVQLVDKGSITLKKWRKATTAEAILDYGFNQAVTMTTDKMLKDVQNTIRTDMFTFMAGSGTTSATGVGLQAAIANTWAKLQTLFEDNAIEAVYFVNPTDIAGYLASAQISTQTAFGMSYLENFLGMGTVIINSSVPAGTLYATAKENLVLYYIPANDADLGNAFEFITDETGYVGIHEVADYTNLTASDVIICGVSIFAEIMAGIVKCTISAAQ